MSDKPAFRKAMETAKFDSVRGPFAFANNHFPIENFYLLAVGHDAQGRVSMQDKGVLLTNHEDAYHDACHMP